MEKGNPNDLLSQIVTFRTYSKYLPHLQRRESFQETINRCMHMHLDRYPKLSKDILKAFQKVHEKKVLPSMRTLQFAGEAINKNNLRNYNCSFAKIDNARVFGEILFLLLSGCGVGYSVQKEHVSKLPMIKQPREEGVFVIHDSIEGWAQSLDILIDAYLYKRVKPIFDFTFIRPKGSYLSTTGAKAPGPEPLKIMLTKVEEKLKVSVGRRLRPLEVHDIICIISDCVLAGGIRRSSLIALFDKSDEEMMKCKSGEWWNVAPWRARANNSVVLPIESTTKEEFDIIFNATKESKSGEPGFFWTNDEFNLGTNPCGEISLNSNQLCNLSSVNLTAIEDKKDFLSAVYSATLIGTIQASYTDFPYIRDVWRTTTEKEALLGVSFTGISDVAGKVDVDWLKEASSYALEVNDKYAKKISINPAARIGCIKPEGTSSTVVGSSSGIHARHSQYYLRRVRMTANDSLSVYLKNKVPGLIEDDTSTANTTIIAIPQESPENSIVRAKESAISLFDRALFYRNNWIAPSHREGINYHNVSCTISVKDDEWDELKEKMWKHRKSYNGISLLPYDGGNYTQAPFEEIDKETYDKYCSVIKDVDLREVKEVMDETDRISTIACGANGCEIV